MYSGEFVTSGIEKKKDAEEVTTQKSAIIELLAMLPVDGSVSHSDFNEKLSDAVQRSYRRGVEHGRASRLRSERVCAD